MFSFQQKKSLKRALLAILVFGLLAAFLAGCKIIGELDINIPGTLPDGLVGEWFAVDEGYGSDGFIITKTGSTITLEYDGGGPYGLDYTGTIRFVSNYDTKSGVIIIEYETPPDYGYESGKEFHAIYYLDFKPETSVELNNTANSSEPYNADTATLIEAVSKFSKGNMGNYMDISVSTTYFKQP
jgi:hypothetical protein